MLNWMSYMYINIFLINTQLYNDFTKLMCISNNCSLAGPSTCIIIHCIHELIFMSCFKSNHPSINNSIIIIASLILSFYNKTLWQDFDAQTNTKLLNFAADFLTLGSPLDLKHQHQTLSLTYIGVKAQGYYKK